MRLYVPTATDVPANLVSDLEKMDIEMIDTPSANIPTELLFEILGYLDSEDLRNAALVCHEFHLVAHALLFKRVSISPLAHDIDRFLAIARVGHLREAVEEVVWKEIQFEGQEHGQRDMFSRLVVDHLAGQTEWAPPLLFGGCLSAMPTRDRLNAMRDSLLADYVEQGINSREEQALGALVEALLSMPKLKKFISIVQLDEFDDIAPHTTFEPLTLNEMRLYFPMSDHAVRQTIFSDSIERPFNGLLTMLRAMSRVEGKIESIEAVRLEGTIDDHGISWRKFMSSEAHHDEYLHAFKCLRQIKLSLSGNYDEDRRWFTGLRDCLEAAERLELLELSVICEGPSKLRTSPVWTAEQLLGTQSWNNLHTVVLSNFSFTTNSLVAFLKRHQRCLRNLRLEEPRLLSPSDTWRKAVAALSDLRIDFGSFVLRRPLDDSVDEILNEQYDIYGSRIRAKELLEYVREGGVNPFDKQRWKARDEMSDSSDWDLSDLSEFDESDRELWELQDSDDSEEFNYHSDSEDDGWPGAQWTTKRGEWTRLVDPSQLGQGNMS